MAIEFNTLQTRTDPGTAPARAHDATSARQDFRSLVLALQAGDIAGARQALYAVREDLGEPAPAGAKTTSTATPASINDALEVLDQALYARGRAEESAPTSAIDYQRFSGMTPYEVYMANPNGLPSGWDWARWSEATGTRDPSNLDVAGNELGADGFQVDSAPAASFDCSSPDFDWARTGNYLVREGGEGSTHTMTINPPANWTGNLELFGSRGASSLEGLEGVKYVVTDASGAVVARSEGFENPSANGLRFLASGAQGPYSVSVTFAGAGKEIFNCLHQP